MKLSLAGFYKQHRAISLIAGVVLCLWMTTGLLHPLLSMVGPRSAAFTSPAAKLEAADFKSFAKVPAQKMERLRLGKTNDTVWWQITQDGRKIYIDAKSGKPDPALEPLHAEALARHYSGDAESQIKSQRLVEEFSLNYPEINRLLPVWEVTLDRPDGLTVYVDTATDRLGAITHNKRRAISKIFSVIHTLSPLDRLGWVRVTIIALAIGSVVVMSVVGVGLLLGIRKKWSLSRRAGWHRVLGLAVVVPIFMFSCSGLFHLFVQAKPALSETPVHTFTLDKKFKTPLFFGAFQDARLLSAPSGNVYWRLQVKDKGFIFSPQTGLKLPLDDSGFAKLFAGRVTTDKPDFVTSFGDEYGFAYKRLPVWKFYTEDGSRIFVDPQDGTHLKVSPLKVWETWSFTRLHKWQFLDPLTGRKARDYIMIAVGVLILALGILGLTLRKR